MKFLSTVLAASLATIIAGQAQAGVSAQEAAKLGTSLTGVGGEMAYAVDSIG